jgi:hypothetical protein
MKRGRGGEDDEVDEEVREEDARVDVEARIGQLVRVAPRRWAIVFFPAFPSSTSEPARKQVRQMVVPRMPTRVPTECRVQ